ncbi:tetraspanin 37 isoform X2 [Morone saxatilis]|uniref:tetraspanin 37 isoform X2 n=1 Tax=Morone saxatilis TaxID=34816 RepID=UPI0015E1FED2|nr:tetraspanin 37 isoform X2 [Morone saxatilis]
MSDRSRNALKTILQLVSQLLWVLGLVVGLSGVYLLMNYRQRSLFFTHAYITLPAIFALASAVFLVVTGGLGSKLSLRDSTFQQGLFVYLLVLVICLESTASALAYFHSTELHSEIAPLSRVFQGYTGSSQDPNSRAVDATQEEDWLKTSWFNHTGGLLVPSSCCNSTFPSCNGTVDQPWQLYTQGCQVKLEMALQFVLSFIFWGAPVVFGVEVVLFLVVAQLMRDQPLMQNQYQVLDKH